MKVLLTSGSIERLEAMLNEHFFSSTYKIVDGKVMFKNPQIENTRLLYKLKGKRHQIYENIDQRQNS